MYTFSCLATLFIISLSLSATHYHTFVNFPAGITICCDNCQELLKEADRYGDLDDIDRLELVLWHGSMLDRANPVTGYCQRQLKHIRAYGRCDARRMYVGIKVKSFVKSIIHIATQEELQKMFLVAQKKLTWFCHMIQIYRPECKF